MQPFRRNNMYEAHNPLWFTLGFIIFAVLFAVAAVQRRRQKLNISQGVLIALGLLAFLQIVLVLALQRYDDTKFRAELRGLAPAEVTKAILERGGLRREITNHQEIGELLGLIQSLRGVAAHHSSPTGKFDVFFEARGNLYHYQLGQDSERADEFWVFPVGKSYAGGEGIEIGRVRSVRLGPLVDNLLKDTR